MKLCIYGIRVMSLGSGHYGLIEVYVKSIVLSELILNYMGLSSLNWVVTRFFPMPKIRAFDPFSGD